VGPAVFQCANAAQKTGIVDVPSADVFATKSKNSERITEVLLGDEFKIIKEEGKWVHGYIPSQKGYSGWMHIENLHFSLKDSPFWEKSLIHIRTSRTKILFRDGSSLDIYAGTRLPLLKKKNDSYEVITPNGLTGFLPVESAWIEDEQFGKEVTPEDIIKAAKFFGSSYKWGGITAGGMDCSGFVYTVFRINGIYLKRDSYLQAEEGLNISSDDLNPGDLVFFKSNKGKRISHVGIYVGNGDFIHSSRSKKGVDISSLSDDFYRKRFVTARRILNVDNVKLQTGQDKEESFRSSSKSDDT
jgi:gamma-D-glutamyl-L-lysine dipeptidyl-peptidase